MKKVIVSILIALICITSVFAAGRSKTANSVTIGDKTIWESSDLQTTFANKDAIKQTIEGAFGGDKVIPVDKKNANLTEIVIGRGITSASDIPADSVFVKWIEEPYCAAYITTHANGERTLTFYTYGNVKVVFPADCNEMFSEKGLSKEISQKIKRIDLSQSDMSDVKSAEKLCNNMKALTDIDLPKGACKLGADSTKDLKVKEMFNNCSNLETFDMSAVNISAVSEAKGMFQRCSSLTTIYCDTATATALAAKSTDKNFSAKMLEGCTSLAGTAYDEDGTVIKNVQYSKNWKSMLTDAAHSGLFTNTDGISGVTMGIVLDGTIKVYFNVINDVRLFTPSSVGFTYPLYSSYSEMVNDTITNFADYNDGSFYRFVANVAASQMGKTITFDFSAGTGNSYNKTKTTSIKDLAQKYIQIGQDATNPNPRLVNLCNAMLTYGALAQIYFGIDASNPVIANPTVSLTDISFTGMTSSPVYVYNGVTGALPDITEFGARFLGNSLVCYSDLRIRHSFKFADGLTWDDFEVTMSSSTITEDGETYEVEDAVFELGVEDVASQPGQKRYYIEVSDFPAAEFDKAYTVTMKSVAEPTMSFSIKYSPMSYVNGAINNSDDNGLKNLCGGIYWFYKNADAYFNYDIEV